MWTQEERMAWKEANPEKAAVYQKKYREKNKEKLKAIQKAWYQKNKERITKAPKDKEKIKEKRKAWAEKNKEKIAARKRARRRTEAGKAAERECRIRYYEKHGRPKNNRQKRSKEYLVRKSRNQIKNLSSAYVRKCIVDSLGIPTSSIPDELVVVKREEIKLKRLIKEKQNEQKSHRHSS